MSNGEYTHIPKVVEDEMIFVAYDTHLYLIYHLSFSHFFWVYSGVGRDVRNVVLLACVLSLGIVGQGQLHD